MTIYYIHVAAITKLITKAACSYRLTCRALAEVVWEHLATHAVVLARERETRSNLDLADNASEARQTAARVVETRAAIAALDALQHHRALWVGLVVGDVTCLAVDASEARKTDLRASDVVARVVTHA